jgi:regulator of replication initiation timing
MNITHEFLALVLQHAASLHAELARMQQDNATLTQENLRLQKHIRERQGEETGVNGTQSGASADEAPGRHAALARRVPL